MRAHYLLTSKPMQRIESRTGLLLLGVNRRCRFARAVLIPDTIFETFARDTGLMKQVGGILDELADLSQLIAWSLRDVVHYRRVYSR